jgi:TolA-binding protein
MTRRGLRILICLLVVAVAGAQHAAGAAPKKKEEPKKAPSKTVTNRPPLVAPVVAPKPPVPTLPTGPTVQTVFDEAEETYRSGDWDKALKAFQDFDKKYPYSGARPVGQYYQGWCYFNLKRYDEAIRVLNVMIMNYPQAPIVPEAMLKLAECYREKKDFQTATKLYREFQQKYKDSAFIPQALMGEAWVLYKMDNREGAKKVINVVWQTYNQNPQAVLDATFLLGRILTDEKKFTEARELFRRISEQSNNPSATSALYSLADSFYEAKNYHDAIKYFKRVQPKAALLASVQFQLQQLTARRGESSIIASQIQQLQTLYNQINQREDLRAVALFRIANAYQELKRPEQASVVYRTLIEKYPTQKTTEFSYFGLIQALTESKRLTEANALTEEFRKKFPQSKMLDSAGYLQAISIFSAGDYKDALQRFEKFLPTCKDPEMVQATDFYIGACRYALEEYPKVVELFNAFIKKYPTSTFVPDVLFRLGRANFELAQRANKPDEIKKLLAAAINHYEEIRAKHPKYEPLPEVIFQLGYLYSYYGTHNEPTAYNKAVGAFTEFVQKWGNRQTPSGRPLAPEAWYQIARANLAGKQFQKAIDAYRQITDNFPDNDLAPHAALEAGSALYDLKKPEEGLAALRAYIAKYPTHIKVGDVLFAIANQLESTEPIEARATYKDLIERTVKADATNRAAWLNPVIEAQRRLVNLYERDNDAKTAIADCETFLTNFADEPVAVREIVARLAAVYRKARLTKDGCATLEKLEEKYRQKPAFRIATATGIIELALAEHDYPRAAAAATKLLQDPEKDRLPSVTYVALGNTFLKTEKPDLARDVFQKTLKLYPNDKNAAPLANLGLGQALLASKDFAGAEGVFNKLMTPNLAETPPEAILGLAKVYQEKGRAKDPKDAINVKAVEYFQIAARSGRRDIKNEAFYHLGMFFFNMKDYKAALPFLMQLFSAPEPMAEEGGFRTAQCHEALGNLPAALSAYKIYVRRYPNGKFKLEANNKITEITNKLQPSK